MGKLTSKKKSTSKKKTTEKKTTAKAKSTTTAKSTAKAVSASEAVKKTEATVKKASGKTKKISVKELVLKKFETTEPEKIFSVMPDENYLKNFSAPEFVDTTDKKEAKRIKALLSEKFDIKSFPVKAEKKPAPAEKKQAPEKPEKKVSPAKPEKKAAPAKPAKKKVSVKELVLKKFETSEPEKLFSAMPDENYEKNFSAPEFVDNTDEKEVKRIKSLLSEKFDIRTFPVKAEEKSAPTEEKPAEKPPAPAKKKVSVQELILKKFEIQEPEKLFSVKPDENYEKNFSCPAFSESANDEENKKIRTLLSMEFDIKTFPEKREEKVPEKPVAEKEIKKEPEPAKAEANPEPAKAEANPEPPAKKPEPIPATDKKGIEPMDTTIKGGLAICIAVIFALLISSYSNNGNYYIVNKKDAIEIQQGRFAPAGRQVLATLPGVNAPEPVKDNYTKEEVFPYVLKYYTEKADAAMNDSVMPDLDKIRSYLDKASSFVVTDQGRNTLDARYRDINLMTSLYKVDVAIAKGKEPDYETALKYLNSAAQLKLETNQAKLVEEKIKLIKNLMGSEK
ncbi:MAG: hypothetical protein GY795_07905 [Desulfobacterales bacterium]|nr:hypothetical protein [Desulfobacterales bacterium]